MPRIISKGPNTFSCLRKKALAAIMMMEREITVNSSEKTFLEKYCFMVVFTILKFSFVSFLFTPKQFNSSFRHFLYRFACRSKQMAWIKVFRLSHNHFPDCRI